MNKKEFKALLGDTYEVLFNLTDTKGEEYAGGNNQTNQLQNFIDAGIDAGIRTEQAWLVHFNKHVAAIKAYVRTGAVKSEPIEGRIDDAILYLILLKAMVRDGSVRVAVIMAPTPAREDE